MKIGFFPLVFVFLVIFSSAMAATILPPGAQLEYAFSDPTSDSDWNKKTGGWLVGNAPFSNVGPGDFAYRTYWPENGTKEKDDLWTKVSIDLSGYDLSSVKWYLGVDNGFKLRQMGILLFKLGRRDLLGDGSIQGILLTTSFL